jgi:hypothetical protein
MNRVILSKSLVYTIILWSSIMTVSGQVTQKIGGNPGTIDPKAVLELESTTKGFLLPRMTAVQVAAITNPTSGMIVFCTDCGVGSDGELRISYNGVWQSFKGNLTGNITGNAATVTTNANLTGAITSNGNATSLGSFTSSNLATAITDETGTGSVVLSNSPTFTGTVTAPIYASTPQPLTDAASISWNPTNGLNASVTLGGNRTLSFTSTPAIGSYGTLVVTQDATGNRTITLPTSLTNKVLGLASTATTIDLSTAANAKDILNFYYDGTYCYWNVGQGYGTEEAPLITNLATNVSGTLAVANGGTGTATLTGYVKGNGTSAMTANPTIPVADVTGAAPLASPTFTGTPTLPTGTIGVTQSAGNNTTALATTAFVTAANSTNANLTGPITSSGNTTSVASQTGTGSTFVMNTSPTLVTPVLGAATATSINSTTIPTSKTLVVTTDKLNVMSSTSSTELAGVISDETGTGSVVLSNSPTFTGSVTSPVYASTPQALTYGSTINWNPTNGLNASVLLGGNGTLSFTSTPAIGSYGTLVVTQDATGNRTITLPGTANKVLGSASTTTIALSTAANAKDILNFYYDGTNYYWNVGQGYGTAAPAVITNMATNVSGTLAVANGGTGATTLTGLVKGNGTGAMTAAVAGTDYVAPSGNITGNAATVTTNANLIGPITSSGNTTSVASQTGTGSTFVMNTSPTLVTPVLGAATATSINSTTIPTSKTLVVTTDKLNVMSSTSSTELAGVISDETGTGSVVLSNSPTFTGSVTAPIYASTPQPLTDGSTISWNPTNGLNASVTLGGNRTLSFTSLPAVGSYGTLIVTQDATGNRTITLPSALTNKVLGSASTTTIALSTAANAKDILNFYYDGTNCYWNIGQGYGTAAPAVITNMATNVSGTLAVANGGTGAATLTGLVKGNGAGAMTAAVAGTDYVAPSGSITGNAATVTTNANLTGPITSSGNTTSIASQTGTGSTFVMNTSPTLVTPVLGAATATSINSTTIPTSKTLVVTTDKLNVMAATSSTELAGVISDETGTGSVVLSASPTFTGTPLAPTATAGTNTTQVATTEFVTGAIATATIPDATTTAKGKIQLAGDLAGTSALPTVPGLALKAPIASPTFTGTVTAPIYASTPQALSDGATITWNPTNGLNASVTLGGNRTLSFASTPAVGSYGTLIVTQDGTGNRTITLPGTANKVLGSASNNTIALSTAANAKDILNFYFDGTSYYWNVGQGYGTAAPAVITNLATGVSGTLPVGNGGTGAATLTGYVKGNGASVMTANATIPVADVTGAAPLASPTFTGTPLAPTATAGTNTTQVATTEFVTSAIAVATIPDATTTAKGKIQLAGDLAGTAALPVVATNAITTSKILDANVTDAKIATVSGSKVSGNITGSAANVTGTVAIANGGTGSTTQNFVDLTTNQTIAGTKTFSSNGSFKGNSIGVGNATGGSNLAVGAGALNAASTGHRNTAIGSGAMQNYVGTSFDNNTSVGYANLVGMTTGSGNTSVGAESMMSLTTGMYNTSIGNQSLINTTGSSNVGVGQGAGGTITTGSNNTMIGTSANVSANNLSNSTALGNGAIVEASNSVQLGNTNVTNVKTSGTLTAGGVTYPNAHGTTGQVLSTTGSGTLTWVAPSASSLSGTVAIANGGTGATTATAALTNLGAAPIASPTFTGTVTSPIYASTPQALTDGTTISWNPTSGLNASVTLGGNRTLSFASTPEIGSYGTLVVTQDATGNRTITLPGTANKVLGSASNNTIALSTAANAKDILNFYFDGASYYWNVGQGYGTAAPAVITNLATGVSGTLPVGNGGTGAATLTGLVKGNGTGAMTAAVAGTDYVAPSGNITGNAATVTTNANLTGVVTSTGNATAIADGALSIAKTNGLQTAIDGKVADAINDATTTVAPSQNAVFDALALKANLAAPTFTGDAKAVTATVGDSDASIATTAFVTNAVTASAGVPYTGATGAVNLGAYNLTVNGVTIGKGNGSLAENTVLGKGAMAGVTGNDNTSIGSQTMPGLLSGASNTAIGSAAGYSLTTGSNNILMGYNANMSANPSNSIAIGTGIDVNTSNTIQIGNAQSSVFKTFAKLTTGTVTYPNTHNSTAGQVLTTDAAGVASWSTPSGVSGSGTLNYIPKFTSTSALGNSSVSDDGTGLRIGNPNGQAGIYTGLSSYDNTRLMVSGGREYESIKMTFPGDPYNNELSFNWYSSAWRMRTERSGGEITDLSFWKTTGAGVTTEKMRIDDGGYVKATGFKTQTGTSSQFLKANGTVDNSTYLSGTVAVANGGTGLTSTPANGQIDIGNGTGFTRATLTAGSAITITNNAGAITISAVVRPTTEQPTVSAAQTSFTLGQTPMNGKVWMFINGVRTNNNAYAIVGTTLTYTPANNNGYVLVAGDRVQFDYCY